jgi:hypothetical protein
MPASKVPLYVISGFRRCVNELLLFWDVTQRIMVATDVSGHLIGPIFKGQAVQEVFLDYLTMRCPETSVTIILRCVTCQKYHVHCHDFNNTHSDSINFCGHHI